MKSLDETVKTLIINGTLTVQPGLFYGKTGIAVFFFHYARQTGNKLFQEYAMNLIEEIQKQITNTESTRYDIGISGIGVGFEYLLRNRFIEADDDLFEDFDNRMYRTAMYEPYQTLNLPEGLTGWGRYFIYRIRGNGHRNYKLHEALKHIAKEIARKMEKKTVPEQEQPDVFRFFRDLTTISDYSKKYADSFKQCKEWKCIRKPDIPQLFPYMNILQRLHVCQNYFKPDLTEEIGQEWEKWEKTNNDSLTDMGLLNGWTSEGLFYLTFIFNIDNSWINLL